TLDDPDSLGRYRVRIGSPEIDAVVPEAPVPQRFVEARAALFAHLRRSQVEVQGAVGLEQTVALADLAGMDEHIDEYVRTWMDGLQAAPPGPELRALLSVDQVTIADESTTLGR